MKCLSLTLVGLLAITVNAQPLFASFRTNTEIPAEKIKANVLKRGTGQKARVRIKLQDGTKRKGYISQAGEDSFAITDSISGQTSTFAYRDVVEVKGQGLSTAAKIGIGVGIGVGVLVVVFAIALRNFDPLNGL
ncbi:MAG: hypothetical protein ABR577_16605 [Pyrinomonadaceae bacterium]